MIKINDDKFEEYVKALINKKITHVKLAKELKTDTRTLKDRIYSLQNQELLVEYFKVFPYKPKENKNIDYEAFVIELIKSNEQVSMLREKYQIAERTYRRNINKLKNTNNRLYKIYKSYIDGKISEEDLIYINSLEIRKVSYTNDSAEDRKAELMQLFFEYEQLLQEGLDIEQILEQLGENSKSLKRKNNELKRILLENKITATANFKERIKVEDDQLLPLEEKRKTEIEVKPKGRGE